MNTLTTLFSEFGYTLAYVECDGKIKRFKLNKDDHKNSGFYCAFQNFSTKGGELYYTGTIGDWKSGESHNFCTLKTLYSYDKKMIADQRKDNEKQIAADKLIKYSECRKSSVTEWESATTDFKSLYLNRKSINKNGARLFNKKLLIPVQDFEGVIHGIQRIDDETGQKLFKSGTKKEGNFFKIGDDSEYVFICEGFATGATIHEATGKTVYVAFDAGNIEHVVKSLLFKINRPIIIAGDNDHESEKGNRGLIVAQSVALKYNLKFAVPDFEKNGKGKTDFNDLGIIETRKQLVFDEKPKSEWVQAIGFIDNFFYYISSLNSNLTCISNHSPENLMSLMPLAYWQTRYPSKLGVDWNLALSELKTACLKRGNMEPSKIRGIGVWKADGKTIATLGKNYFNGNALRPVFELNNSKHFYEPKSSDLIKIAGDLTMSERQEIIEAISLLPIESLDEKMYLLGFFVSGFYSGLLSWRPHVWLTGEAGSGKSTVLRDLVKRLLGNFAFYAGKTSTEAGIRRVMQNNAGVLVYDEFETRSEKTRSIVENCLNLICQSSTNESGHIVKAQGVRPVMFKPNFSAMVASIRQPAIMSEEVTRFSFINFDKNLHKKENYLKFSSLVEKFDDEFQQKFFGFLFKNADRFFETLEVFKEALKVDHTARFAEQYATLYAGAFLLDQNGIGTSEYLQSFSSPEHRESVVSESESDQEECLNFLMTATWKDDTGTSWTLEKVLDYVSQTELLGYIPTVFLETGGVKIYEERVNIYVKSDFVNKLFAKTQWGSSWNRSLKRSKLYSPATVRFHGLNKKCIAIKSGRKK